MRGSGKGWVTAEYGMLPRSTHQRMQRDVSKGKINGRGSEIQRLIGRSLRAAIDMEKLGERSILIDCDVIQADGGTRTASITGAFIALVEAVAALYDNKGIFPVRDFLAATSVGLDNHGNPVLDLCYAEDSQAIVDMNVVMSGSGEFIEIQGTGEGRPFSHKELSTLLCYAEKGIDDLISYQKDVLGEELVWKVGRES